MNEAFKSKGEQAGFTSATGIIGLSLIAKYHCIIPISGELMIKSLNRQHFHLT
jgi:hypothetical protein